MEEYRYLTDKEEDILSDITDGASWEFGDYLNIIDSLRNDDRSKIALNLYVVAYGAVQKLIGLLELSNAHFENEFFSELEIRAKDEASGLLKKIEEFGED